MKKALIIGLVALAVLGAVAAVLVMSPWDEPEKLVWAFPPGETTDMAKLREMFGPIVDATCAKMGVECEMVMATDYAAVMEALRNGTADVAHIGSTMYVLNRDQFPMRLVTWDVIEGDDHYHAVLIGKPGSFTEPFAMDQLKGKTVAFVTPTSTSGYIAPLTMMLDAGLTLDNLKSYYFTENHPAAVEAVLNGQVDVAATGNTVTRELVRSGEAVEGVDFVTLVESPPLVSDVWAIGPGADQATSDAIAEAMLSLPPEAFEGSYLDGFTPVDMAAYEFNVRMLKAAGELK